MQDDNLDSAEFNYYRKRISSGEKLSFALKIYAFAGVFMALFGTGFIAYSKLEVSLNTDEQAALAVAMMGVLITVLSYGLLRYRSAINERNVERFAEHQAVGRFIEAWSRFEDTSVKAAFGKSAEARNYGLRDTLKRLKTDGKLGINDQLSADNLLQMRNALVHGARRFTLKELDEALNQLVSLISKLS